MTSDALNKEPAAVAIDGCPKYGIEFSFCSLVTDTAQYSAMIQSMKDAGFDESCAEYLYLDNRVQNQGDGYAGLNLLANHARGKYIVFCHQDVLAIDGPDRLREIVAGLSRQDPAWAVLGNAGLRGGARFMYLNEQASVCAGKSRRPPERIESLDENFILLRQDARLGFSNDLSGFHLYGTDLVSQASLRGLTAYVVDFRVEHLGKGKIDRAFHDACTQFEEKYARAFTPRTVNTTCTSLDLGTVDGEGRARRLAYFAPGGAEFVRPSKKAKKAIRSYISGNRIEMDGLQIRYPRNLPYSTYHELRKDLYERPMRQSLQDYLRPDTPVVELGAGFGVLSGVISRILDPSQRQVVVESDPQLLALCEQNVRCASPERDIRAVNAQIVYAAKASACAGDRAVARDRNAPSVPTTTLSQVLEETGMDCPYGLVCDIDGIEFDLIDRDVQGLEYCQTLILKLNPSAYYARGETAISFLHNLEAAGFTALASTGAVLVAARKPAG
ncbi:hypothetical protein I5535_09680 [Rhodobacteraceae bacterium F11138]|nr:hypothetical protein [Rhodobacteraceae bacterium F11138]